MKTALVHERLNVLAGSEKVLFAVHDIFPEAPVYTAISDSALTNAHLPGVDIHTSFLQKLPLVAKHHQKFLPLYMLAFEQFDLTGYDLVISSSHCAAKAVITRPSACHVCYCHSPMRYAWDMQHAYTKYQGRLVRGAWAMMSNYVRLWDLGTSFRVDRFVANSAHVARRIRKYYGKPAEVIYPPVDIDRFTVSSKVDDYYVVLSRFAPYKRVDMVIKAFNRLGIRLLVIGSGEQESELKKLAGKNIEFLGHVPDAGVAQYLSRARGSVIAAEEDFGITTVEGIAAGRPVVAYGVGGSAEIITDGENGVLFHEPTVESLVEAVGRCESLSWNPEAIKRTSERFGADVFRREMKCFVERAIDEHRSL